MLKTLFQQGARMVVDLRSELAAIAEQLLRLQVSVDQLAARLDRLEGGFSSTPSRTAGSAAGSSVPEAPGPSAGIAAASGPPLVRAGLDSKVKHYCVVVGNAAGTEGVYRTYQLFAEAVKSEEPWTGRGPIPFARGVVWQSFPTRREAQHWFREQAVWDDAEPVPYRG